MVDSNLQREHILPSEKAFAYKMKMEALSHQGKTSRQVGEKWSVSQISEAGTDSERQIHRYIRLTNLILDILQMVDDGKIALTPAVELSYLQNREQEVLFSIMDCDEVTPSLSQAQRLRRMSEEQTFTDRAAMEMLSEVMGNQVEYVKVPVDSLRSYFRPNTSTKQMTETLFKAMEFYKRHLERQRSNRDAR
jgi:ParB family chromosome partitioning protein